MHRERKKWTEKAKKENQFFLRAFEYNNYHNTIKMFKLLLDRTGELDYLRYTLICAVYFYEGWFISPDIVVIGMCIVKPYWIKALAVVDCRCALESNVWTIDLFDVFDPDPKRFWFKIKKVSYYNFTRFFIQELQYFSYCPIHQQPIKKTTRKEQQTAPIFNELSHFDYNDMYCLNCVLNEWRYLIFSILGNNRRSVVLFVELSVCWLLLIGAKVISTNEAVRNWMKN